MDQNMETALTIAVIGVILALATLLVYYPESKSQRINAEIYCDSDSDCACGTHQLTGQCFYGNAKYVNKLKQCPDFCNGPALDKRVVCISNVCRQVVG